MLSLPFCEQPDDSGLDFVWIEVNFFMSFDGQDLTLHFFKFLECFKNVVFLNEKILGLFLVFYFLLICGC